MCDECRSKTALWGGWNPIPSATSPISSAAPWLDLSHPIGINTPTMAVFEKPKIERILELPRDPANITRFQMVVHQGTHVDAPFHMFADGPAMSDIPLDRLMGRGVVWRIDKEPYELIDVDDFERASPAVEPGDIVLLDTGWARHANTETYDRHPSLSVEAAQWLVGKGVKLLGVDFATPDLNVSRRPAGFTWPVHLALLGQGVLVAEHLTNLGELANKRAEIIFGALNIEGADGAPARVLARPVAA